MTCFSPLQAYSSDAVSYVTGKKIIAFKSIPMNWILKPVNSLKIPCGRCIGCRLERKRQWAVRLMHEASLYDSNCYLTLTYSETKLPIDRSLDVRHFQLFMKRLRKRFGNGIRFFHCGEYSPLERRPHYHACVFNFDFPDRKFLKMNKSGEFKIFTSEICDELWTFGHCFIGDVSFNSAAYVAGYIVDKINGPLAFDHYTDKETGVMLKPEYVTMSRGSKSLGTGGLGKGWLDKYFSDVYPSDQVIVHGLQMRPPKFYDSKLEERDAELLAVLKAKREGEASKYSADQTPARLSVREKVRLAKLNLFKRS